MSIVTLLDVLVKGLIEAEEKFLENPKDFYSLEKAIKSTTEEFSAKYLGEVLSSVDEQICKCGWRKGKYNIQRKDKRTIITSVGDVTFDCTYFKNKAEEGKYIYLLEEMIGLDKHERFSEEAEVMMLTEALKTSYKEAAQLLPTKQKITKTTVMNKVHQITKEIPYEEKKNKKEAEYLYIEADEDHIAEQHGKKGEETTNFISKLIYVHEGKKEGKAKRKELQNKYYFSGVYQGKKENEKLWKNVQEYIKMTYEEDKIKRVYISGDGARWIKSGVDYIDKALFSTDKYHLMKYINKAVAQFKEEKEAKKEEIWKILYSRKRKGKEEFKEYIKELTKEAEKEENIERLEKFVIENWKEIGRSLKDEKIEGCSAESHVSHVLSDRLSSRPMGWSQIGADRMSKLRCYEKNYGRVGIINLVRYRREQKRKGDEEKEKIDEKKVTLREIRKEQYSQAKSYIDRIQAEIPGLTAKKTISIRNHIRMI